MPQWNKTLGVVVGTMVSAVIQTVISGTGVLPMIPAIGVVLVLGIAACGLVWRWTKASVRLRVIGMVALAAFAICASFYIHKTDRPIFEITVDGLAVHPADDGSLGLFILVGMRNIGMQESYVDHWNLDLIINGEHNGGEQRFGEHISEDLADLPLLRENEDMPRGKLVRGWLVFRFPFIPEPSMRKYFLCSNRSHDGELKINLRVVDYLDHASWKADADFRDLKGQWCRENIRPPK